MKKNSFLLCLMIVLFCLPMVLCGEDGANATVIKKGMIIKKMTGTPLKTSAKPKTTKAEKKTVPSLESLFQQVLPKDSGDDLDEAKEKIVLPDLPNLVVKGDKATYFYRCKYIQSSVLKSILEDLMSPSGVVVDSEQINMLIVRDSSASMVELVKYIEQLDQFIPQVVVETRVVEVTVDSDLEQELSHIFTHDSSTDRFFWQSSSSTLETPGANPTTGQGLNFMVQPWRRGMEQLQSFVRILLTKGKAKILSAPNLVVENGSDASIITGEEVPIQTSQVVSGSVSLSTQFKRVGIKLKVKPLQITSDSVRLSINPEVSTVTGFTNPGTNTGAVSNPIVAIRNAKTSLRVKDGEVITIGGLLRSEDREVNRKVPLLGDIPILGLLFRSRRKETIRTHLMFFLRIHILDEGKKQGKRIFKPGEDDWGVNSLFDPLLEFQTPTSSKPIRGGTRERRDGRRQ